jgi:starch phosphorylase
MKFAMNGAPIIGTLDGANIEIGEEVGADNIFIFGLTVPQVRQIYREGGYHPWPIYQQSSAARRVLDALKGGRFSPGEPGRYEWVYHKLVKDGESYFHLADLESYLQTHETVTRLYGERGAWTAKAILNTAHIGKFSSDRTIREYAHDIWNLPQVP